MQVESSAKQRLPVSSEKKVSEGGRNTHLKIRPGFGIEGNSVKDLNVLVALSMTPINLSIEVLKIQRPPSQKEVTSRV